VQESNKALRLTFQNSITVIKDADMAAEMTEYSKQSVLVQSATSMLAQANASSQFILSLFR